MALGNTPIQVLIHKNDTGALVLAKILLPKFTSWSKHYHTKNVWFQEEIVKCGITLLKNFTIEQLWYLFTKGLPKAEFEHLRKKLMEW